MGLHAENHLQSARSARTAGSRQPALPGVPLGDRRSPRRKKQTRQTLAAGGTGRPPLLRVQPVRSRTTRTCSVPSFAASSTSADCRTKRCAAICRNSAAARYHACSNDSERTDSSRRSATPTSTTSLHLAKKSLLPLSNSGNLSSSRSSPSASLSNFVFLPENVRILM